MRKLIPIALIFLSSCMHAKDAKYQQLQDTLQKLRTKLDFRPLVSTETYAFINKYYLPNIDSSKRKLFIYPITGKNFKVISDEMAMSIQAQYNDNKDSNNYKISIPALSSFNKSTPIFSFDKSIQWDRRRIDCPVILDTLLLNIFKYPHHFEVYDMTGWYKKYGRGYIAISYPLYNHYTKLIYIHQYIIKTFGGVDDNYDDDVIWYQKTKTGWQRY